MEASRAQLLDEGEALRIAANPILSRVDVREVLDEELIAGDVPLEIVYTEDVPVEEDNVAEIRAQLRTQADKGTGRNGQLLPVLLAEVTDTDIDLLYIADGFHR